MNIWVLVPHVNKNRQNLRTSCELNAKDSYWLFISRLVCVTIGFYSTFGCPFKAWYIELFRLYRAHSLPCGFFCVSGSVAKISGFTAEVVGVCLASGCFLGSPIFLTTRVLILGFGVCFTLGFSEVAFFSPHGCFWWSSDTLAFRLRFNRSGRNHASTWCIVSIVCLVSDDRRRHRNGFPLMGLVGAKRDIVCLLAVHRRCWRLS